jgi:hypothetical protein
LPSLPQPTMNPKRKLYGKAKIKTDIALQQNCDQSAKIWWSTQSSTWHWWVREWRLTLNESADNNRKPTLIIRDIILGWLVLFARETFFCYRDTILKKQTNPIFRKPPVDANSKFLWNTAIQIICYPNQDTTSIHQCENLKQKYRAWFILENLNYMYIKFLNKIVFNVTALCTTSELQFLLPCQMKQECKRI